MPNSVQNLFYRIRALFGLTGRMQKARETNRESLACDRQILELIPMGVYVCDALGKATYFNRHAAEILGRRLRIGEPEEIFSCSYPFEQLDGSPLFNFQSAVARVLAKGQRYQGSRLLIERPDGSRAEISVNIDPIRERDGAICGAVSTFSDITGRSRSERALRQRAEELEKLLEVVPSAVWVANDPACRNITGNYRANQFYEAGPGENVSASEKPEARRFFTPEGRELAPEELPMQLAAATNQELRDVELEVKLASGRSLSLLGGAMPLRNDQGQVRGAIASFLDITARKQAEAALKKSEERLRLAQESAQVGVWEWNLGDNTIEWTDQLGRLYGYDSGAIITGYSAFYSRVHPDDIAEVERQRDAAVAAHQPFDFDFRICLPSGAVRWVNSKGAAVYDEAGKPQRLFGVNIDISERKRIEESLRASERRFRAIFNHQFQYSCLLTPGGVIIEISDSAINNTGIRAADIIGKLFIASPWWRSLPESRAQWLRLFEEAQARPGPAQGEIPYLMANGSMRHALSTVTAVRDDQGGVEYLLAEGLDITERKQAEQSFQESRQQLELALEAGQLGFWDWDVISGRVQFGGRWAAMLGYQLSEIEPHVRTWERLVHPEEKDDVMAVLAEHLAGRTDFYECEHRMRHKDGSWRWILDRGQVVARGAGGEGLRAVGTHADVTARHEAEEALREANHRKDEFLAMLGHELRNPLTPITTVAHLLKQGTLDDATLKWACAMLNRNVEIIGRLVNDLLDVSRITRGLIQLQQATLDLRLILSDSREAIFGLIQSKRQTLASTIPEQPILVYGDAIRLTQVFTNLLHNAAKYTDEGGRIELTVLPKEESVLITVRDDGIGLAPGLQPFIFDLFTQGERGLARSEGGLGIGLTLVKRLIELHGGSITVYSAGVNQGSTFTVALPLLSQRKALAENKSSNSHKSSN